MGRQSLPQRQLLTVRQILIALGIVACLAFIVSYSGRIVLNSRVESEQEYLERHVQEQEKLKTQITGWLDDIENPAHAEAFARNELNWELPGDQAVVTLNPGFDKQPEPIPTPLAYNELEEGPEPENWQLWLELFNNGWPQPVVEEITPGGGTNLP